MRRPIPTIVSVEAFMATGTFGGAIFVLMLLIGDLPRDQSHQD